MSPQAKNPLDVMVITREKLQDAFDDAVRRGRMTRDDAADLLADIVGRAVAAPAEHGPGADAFPIAEYDELTAAQIVAQLDVLESVDLRRVRDYERRNANRKTVLAAVDTKLAQ